MPFLSAFLLVLSSFGPVAPPGNASDPPAARFKRPPRAGADGVVLVEADVPKGVPVARLEFRFTARAGREDATSGWIGERKYEFRDLTPATTWSFRVFVRDRETKASTAPSATSRLRLPVARPPAPSVLKAFDTSIEVEPTAGRNPAEVAVALRLDDDLWVSGPAGQTGPEPLFRPLGEWRGRIVAAGLQPSRAYRLVIVARGRSGKNPSTSAEVLVTTRAPSPPSTFEPPVPIIERPSQADPRAANVGGVVDRTPGAVEYRLEVRSPDALVLLPWSATRTFALPLGGPGELRALRAQVRNGATGVRSPWSEAILRSELCVRPQAPDVSWTPDGRFYVWPLAKPNPEATTRIAIYFGDGYYLGPNGVVQRSRGPYFRSIREWGVAVPVKNLDPTVNHVVRTLAINADGVPSGFSAGRNTRAGGPAPAGPEAEDKRQGVSPPSSGSSSKPVRETKKSRPPSGRSTSR